MQISQDQGAERGPGPDIRAGLETETRRPLGNDPLKAIRAEFSVAHADVGYRLADDA